ncbi:Nuclear transport factor 2 [Sesamum angolense]|uniref:Nuclear transport factor 2 n=1 Tax=Sesamum angolense TaxID=2727404 RepID=A0AAE1T8P5_9LAMI|nr:Nuclear transport factor 2 [Sesamum angolense]
MPFGSCVPLLIATTVRSAGGTSEKLMIGMATQTATLPPAPSAQVVGNAFVEQYYHILHHSPELVFRFYQDTSVLSRPDADGLMTTVTTMKSINDKICSLDYKNYKAEIKTADAQDSYKDGVIVLVTGCLTGKDNLRKKFTQTFFLAPQDKGYYVLNDVFRYVEESEPDISSGVVLGVNETTSSSLGQDPEPAQVVDPPHANDATSTAEEVETNQKKTGDQVIDERQASSDRDILVEAESHLNENHESAVAESDPSASQEDVPKKSYASIVSSQAKKGPTKVYVPASPAKGTSAKTESQPVNPATEASESEAAAPVPPDNEQESEDAEDEVEGHSIYIRNLPLNATVAQLEAEFKKFGTIKPNGVQQQGFCFGFVEFQEFSSMQSAIKASPITIGDRQAAVEIKRTTTRVGSGRGRFTSSRGGFHNDNFRGRGNFGSGRTYVRNDNFRGRGNFSSGHGGEGYQQGRGRGGEGYQQGRGRGGRRYGPSQIYASV